jgi:hypothetical protein
MWTLAVIIYQHIMEKHRCQVMLDKPGRIVRPVECEVR